MEVLLIYEGISCRLVNLFTMRNCCCSNYKAKTGQQLKKKKHLREGFGLVQHYPGNGGKA